MYHNLSFPGALDLIAAIQACSWGRLDDDSGICDLGSESFIKLLTYLVTWCIHEVFTCVWPRCKFCHWFGRWNQK